MHRAIERESREKKSERISPGTQPWTEQSLHTTLGSPVGLPLFLQWALSVSGAAADERPAREASKAYPHDQSEAATDMSFPHESAIRHSTGQGCAFSAVLDAKGCSARSTPAFTDGSTTHFASPTPDFTVSMHEAVHQLQHAGITHDQGLGPEGHAQAVTHLATQGRPVKGLLGHRGHAVPSRARNYIELANGGRLGEFQQTLTYGTQTAYAAAGLIASADAVLKKQQSGISLSAGAGSDPEGLGLSKIKVSMKNKEFSEGQFWKDCGRAAREVMGPTGTDTPPEVVVRPKEGVTRYRVTENMLELLEEEGVPAEETGKLKAIQGQEFIGRNVFLDRLWELGVVLGVDLILARAAFATSKLDAEELKSGKDDEEFKEYKPWYAFGKVLVEMDPSRFGKDPVKAYEKYRDENDNQEYVQDKIESGLDEKAAPDVGEAYVIGGGKPTESIHISKQRFNWHWATVIIADGPDRVTFESFSDMRGNYGAKTEGRETGDAKDKGWYFSTYGTERPEQTFHAGYRAFVDPDSYTFVVRTGPSTGPQKTADLIDAYKSSSDNAEKKELARTIAARRVNVTVHVTETEDITGPDNVYVQIVDPSGNREQSSVKELNNGQRDTFSVPLGKLAPDPSIIRVWVIDQDAEGDDLIGHIDLSYPYRASPKTFQKDGADYTVRVSLP